MGGPYKYLFYYTFGTAKKRALIHFYIREIYPGSEISNFQNLCWIY